MTQNPERSEEVYVVTGIPSSSPVAFEDEDVARAYADPWVSSSVEELTPISRDVAERDGLLEE